MKKAATLLFAIFLFVAHQTSFAFPADHKSSLKKSEIWIEDIKTDIEVNLPHSKKVQKQERTVEIIAAINAAYDIDNRDEKRQKIGTIKVKEFGTIEVYFSKDKRSVYLLSEEGEKIMTTEKLYELFQSPLKAQPLPRGYEPDAFPPLPKGEGLQSDDVKKLNGAPNG